MRKCFKLKLWSLSSIHRCCCVEPHSLPAWQALNSCSHSKSIYNLTQKHSAILYGPHSREVKQSLTPWQHLHTYFQTAGKCRALRPLKLSNFQFYQTLQPSNTVVFCSWPTCLALLPPVKYAFVPIFKIPSSFQSLCTRFFPFWCHPASSHHCSDPLITNISAPFLMCFVSSNHTSCLLITLPLFTYTICPQLLGSSKISNLLCLVFSSSLYLKIFPSISSVLASFCISSLPTRPPLHQTSVLYSLHCNLSSLPSPARLSPLPFHSSREGLKRTQLTQKFASTELNHEIEFAYANEVFQIDFQNHVWMDIKHELTHPTPTKFKAMSYNNSRKLPRNMWEGKKKFFIFFILQLHLKSIRRGCSSQLTHGAHVSKLKIR